VKVVHIFTDGACKGNPGPGGWGALLRCEGKEKKIYGGEKDTTNNRMEMLAVIKALEALNRRSVVHIHTDSQYIHKGMTTWIHNWKKRGWKNAQKQPIKNSDLWQLLDSMVHAHEIHWHWVRGHSGHIDNEEADRLANLGVASL
jgi:ribonuclease HI